MKYPDQELLALQIGRNDDGDILLSQGDCGCGDEVTICLHPSHVALIVEASGYVPVEIERLQDRLNLLAEMVRAHTKPGDQLRSAAEYLIGKPFPTEKVKQEGQLPLPL